MKTHGALRIRNLELEKQLEKLLEQTINKEGVVLETRDWKVRIAGYIRSALNSKLHRYGVDFLFKIDVLKGLPPDKKSLELPIQVDHEDASTAEQWAHKRRFPGISQRFGEFVQSIFLRAGESFETVLLKLKDCINTVISSVRRRIIRHDKNNRGVRRVKENWRVPSHELTTTDIDEAVGYG